MIAFDHVTYTYEGQEQPSLRDCSFTVEPGELILLTGESGCGKTTMIKLINGLLQHGRDGTLEGTVTVNGQEVSQVPLWELAQTVNHFIGVERECLFYLIGIKPSVSCGGHVCTLTFFTDE